MKAPGSRSLGKYVLPVVLLLGFPVFILILWTFLGPIDPDKTLSVEADDPIGREFSDRVEDAVMEAEEMLRDLARQIESAAAGGVLYHIAPEFKGTAFAGNPQAERKTIGGVDILEGRFRLRQEIEKSSVSGLAKSVSIGASSR